MFPFKTKALVIGSYIIPLSNWFPNTKCCTRLIWFILESTIWIALSEVAKAIYALSSDIVMCTIPPGNLKILENKFLNGA